MAVLVVQIPPRPRLVAASAAAPGTGDRSGVLDGKTEFVFALTDDGLSITSQGRAPAAQFPRADAVVAVLASADVAWQQITLPKAPPAKMRAALIGMLEDRLLDEPESLHVALSPASEVGKPTWVAITDRAWVAQAIALLEKRGTDVDRVVPPMWPGDVPQGHFFDANADGHGKPLPSLMLADANGIVTTPLAGTLARALLPTLAGQAVRWSATAAVAAPAERWLGAAVPVRSETEHLVTAARSLWNLRQFDLARRHRGSRVLLDGWKRLMSPGWRPARVGLISLVVLHLVGLNGWAWAQRQAIEAKKQAQVALLKSAHPQVRVVVDAPLQMRSETETLRAAAGRTGDADLEGLLTVAAAAWPDGFGPAQGLRFEDGQLTLATAGWSDAQLTQFRERLRLGGWAVDGTPARVVISRATGRPGVAR
jgi:general secretion pathway protein L